MSSKILSISIVLYNTPRNDLKRCIESLKKVSIPFDLFLIDNSPGDCLSDMVVLYPGTIYYHFPNNPGYGSGHNVAIKKCGSGNYQFHLVINADVYFDSAVLS